MATARARLEQARATSRLPGLLLGVLLLAGSDLLALSLAVWVSFEARAVIMGDNTIPKLATIIWPIWLAAAWQGGLYPGWGLGPAESLRRVTRAVAVTFVLTTFVLYFAGGSPGWARIALLMSGSLGWVLVLLARWLARAALVSLGLWGMPAAVLGGGRTGRELVQALRRSSDYGFRPVAIYDDDPALQGREIGGVPVAGPLSSVAGAGHKAVFLAIPRLPRARLLDLLAGPLGGVQKVFLVPDLVGVESMWVEARDVGGVLTLEVQRHLLRPEAQLAKRALDLAGAAVVLLLVAPLALALALAIRLDTPGSVLFRQTRVGRGGREFLVWKFRTMRPDAANLLERHLALHPELREQWAKDHKLRDDPRVTRIGRLLRRTSLDELPQLLNVLAGEMSLVGPRPIVRAEIERYGEDFATYAKVAPGMTGLWQVSGRNDTGYGRRVALDAYYIRNWSVWLDLAVLLRTPAAVLSSRGAY